MSLELVQPSLPNEYQHLFTDSDREVHEDLASTSLGEYRQQMKKAKICEYEIAGGQTIRFVDLRHENEGDSSQAIVMPLPFANGFSPAMFIRAIAMQRMLDEPKRVLMFPNNGLGRSNKWYELPTEEDLRDLRSDHYNPQAMPKRDLLAESITRGVIKKGVEKVDVVGYSQGATVGASLLMKMAGTLDVNSAMLGDPANVEYRTPKQLRKDFQGNGKQGLKDLNQAINDSAIPALTEAQHSANTISTTARQMLMFASFGLGSQLSVNKDFHLEMKDNNFVNDLLLAGSSSDNLLVVRMEDSLVCTPRLVGDMKAAHLDDALEIVEGYGHEGGDNVILHSILARLAIEGRS